MDMQVTSAHASRARAPSNKWIVTFVAPRYQHAIDGTRVAIINFCTTTTFQKAQDVELVNENVTTI